MERVVKSYDKECMKMAILKHEETFKEQVYELHRLYRIQKVLMKNHGNYINNEQRKTWKKLNLERPAKDYMMDKCGEGDIENESDIELTLGPTSFGQKKKDEIQMNSDTGPSFSSSSNESIYVQRRNSITHKPNDGKEDLRNNNWGIIQVPNLNSNALDVDEQFRQKQSPWLFQVLSLNIT